MPKPKSAPTPTGSPDTRFRGQIEAAVAAGVAPEAMTLKLTLRDSDMLVRDRSIAVADIHYAEGVMRFLGVRVEKGGVPASVLEGAEEA